MLKFIFIFPIRFYQICISPFLGAKCRFYPSCSQYALECFETFPFYLSLWYSIRRILKCHPFHSGGFDPIPEAKK